MSTDTLTNSDMVELTEWRHLLHRNPELSGEERETAGRVAAWLAGCAPDRMLTGLGGHGVAAVFEGAAPGETLLLRCELDGLPIEDLADVSHRSEVAGKGHLCGHDGHMAILAAVARVLGRTRPARGRAVLLFQPAEEDGAGAARVLADPDFAAIRPDISISLHNMPGLPLGHAALAEGPANCASRGMRIVLCGRTAHASQPETGTAPTAALARLMQDLPALSRGTGPEEAGFTLVTVTHAAMGAPAFGVAPGAGELWCTLRSLRDARMEALVAAAEAQVRAAAEKAGLGVEITYHDVFRHCDNHPEATALLARALEAEGIPVHDALLPMRGSEDFGRFGDVGPSAMFLLGAGENSPALHNPDYDFPDALIGVGARVFLRAVRDRLG